MAKLFVIAGHGAGDPGACAGGYKEADLVRQLAAKLQNRGGSEVQVGDTSVNWYASNYIGKGHCPSGVPVIELHMDSASASAKGGHVIIKSGFSADSYDNNLANFIGVMFPGRSEKIQKRSNLANVNRAARMGVNYRLLECCFISNESDRTKFINEMDKLADGILAAFGIGSNGSSTPSTPSTSQPSTSVDIDDLARRVINGEFGNGDARKKALGSNYDAVQKRVNEMLSGKSSSEPAVDIDDLARRTIAGEFGNGDARKKALGSNYDAVQKRVNEMLGGKSSSGSGKSIDQIAKEVIRGDWGNGEDRKRRLTAAGYDYNAIQKRVNQLL